MRISGYTLLAVVIILVVATLAAIFWTFVLTDPQTTQYKDVQLQIGISMLHFLLFIWMMLCIVLAFTRYIEKGLKA